MLMVLDGEGTQYLPSKKSVSIDMKSQIYQKQKVERKKGKEKITKWKKKRNFSLYPITFFRVVKGPTSNVVPFFSTS